MENIKEIFASFGLWSLVEDISDDGDGIGDDLQLTKEGEEARRMIEQELSKAREEGRREQAELDRTLYGVSFEHIKNADFEKILLESVDKAKENIIKDLIKKIEEAHCDSISLELLKEIDLSKLK